MNKEKIKWCCRQNKGIELIDKKVHLSKSYMEEADDSLDACINNVGKWKLITGYYACYNALYSLLMKCGIKCEIHDCTISLMELFGFTKSEIDFMEDLKYKRIRAQYYLEDLILDDFERVKDFVFRSKELLEELNSAKIEEIINKLKEVLNE